MRQAVYDAQPPHYAMDYDILNNPKVYEARQVQHSTTNCDILSGDLLKKSRVLEDLGDSVTFHMLKAL